MAMPSDLRKVLSPIGDASDSLRAQDYLTFPYPNEMQFPIVYTETSPRLGATATDFSHKIEYYRTSNSTVKYDIWNKNKPVNWFTASTYSNGTYNSMWWVLAGTDQNSTINVEKYAPELFTAGLAPIFLIGSTTGEQ